MGLLDDFIENFEDVKESTGYGQTPEGVYDFVVDEPFVKEGSSRDENWRGFMIPFILNDGKKDIEHTDVYTLPASPRPSEWNEKESGAMSRLKSRLLSLGLSRDDADHLNTDLLVGVTGTLQIKHRKQGEQTYVNIVNLKATGTLADAPAEKPVRVERKAEAPAPRRRRAAPKPDPVAEAEVAEIEDDADEPVAEAPKPRRTRRVAAKPVEPEPEDDEEYDVDPDTAEVTDKPMALAEDDEDDEPADEDPLAAIRAKRAARLAAGSGQRKNPFER